LKLKGVSNFYLSLYGFLLLSLSGSAMAIDPVYTDYFNDNAISGYDAVAYFTQGKPVTGSDEFTFDYMCATWRFSSQENLDMFIAEPAAYSPQYGGYCAYAAPMLRLCCAYAAPMLCLRGILPAPSQTSGQSKTANCI
jgi:YHS domain-containing protein